jgi:FKBP-type peptidyl-prolyl cis-trans isomerase
MVDIAVGDSESVAVDGCVVQVHYVGKLASTKATFDKSPKNQPFEFRLGHDSGVIRGWHVGIVGMRIGGTRQVTIPPEKAYGRRGMPPEIPSNETLIFKVKLVDVI